MQAIILAAGYGRRMEPLSEHCHKALLPVGGTTILGRIMDALGEVGVRDVVVATGYRAEDVESFLLEHYPETAFEFVRNDRYRDTNNIVSLSLALENRPLDQDVLLLECDLLFDPSILQRLIDHPSGNVALVDRYRTGMDGTVVTVANGIITGVFPPEVQDATFNYDDKLKTLNIYRFEGAFCRSTLRPLVRWYAEQIDSTSYYELVLGMLMNLPSHHIAAEVVDGDRWVEVDDPNDLAVARFQFEPERRAEILDRAFGGQWNFDVLDFAFMRNAYFPTEAMLAAMRHSLPALVAAYGSSQTVLNDKLGLFLRCDPSRLQILNGASQIFPILKELLGQGRVGIPSPTFGEYRRAFPSAACYEDRPGIRHDDLDRLAKEVGALVAVNPNTPTGTTLDTADLYAHAVRHPDTTLIVDESFLPFSDQPSLIGLLERAPLPNVAVLASLSKSLGAPGLRLGYLYSCDPSLVAAVGACIPIWNVNSIGEYLLELLLKFRPALDASLRQSAADRDQLATHLAELAIVQHVNRSGGNFLLVTLRGGPSVAGDLRRSLLAGDRIEVKDVTDRFPDGPPRLRIAVRRPQDNDRLVAALLRYEA